MKHVVMRSKREPAQDLAIAAIHRRALRHEPVPVAAVIGRQAIPGEPWTFVVGGMERVVEIQQCEQAAPLDDGGASGARQVGAMLRVGTQHRQRGARIDEGQQIGGEVQSDMIQPPQKRGHADQMRCPVSRDASRAADGTSRLGDKESADRQGRAEDHLADQGRLQRGAAGAVSG